MNRWPTIVPPVSLIALAIGWVTHPENPVGVTIVAVFLVAAVLAAVHHAEVVAHRVGDPLGSLVLAVAVTVIEVALIVTLMIGGSKDTSTLARDTVFAAVMISLNGIVGLSLVVGALKHHLARMIFRTFKTLQTAQTQTPIAIQTSPSTRCLT